MKRDESPFTGAKREIEEETGLKLPQLRPHGSFRYSGLGKRETVSVFSANVTDAKITLQREEIAAARWFAGEKLPTDLAPASKIALQKLTQHR